MSDIYDLGIGLTGIVCIIAYIIFIIMAWYEFLSDVANNRTHCVNGNNYDFSDMLGLTGASFVVSFICGMIVSLAWPLGLPIAILAGMYFIAVKIGERRAASRKLDLSKK